MMDIQHYQNQTTTMASSNQEPTHPMPPYSPTQQQPSGTFDNMNFSQLMDSYNTQNTLFNAVSLTQAFLMTNNFAAASNTQPIYMTVSDYVNHADSLADSMAHVGKLVQGLGPADRSTNFIIAQKQLMQAQLKEDAELRKAVSKEIVDGTEYARVREQILFTKQRVQKLLKVSEDSSASDSEDCKQQTAISTQDLQNKSRLTQKRIQSVINQMRSDAREYLGINNPNGQSLTWIYNKLSSNKNLYKKRDLKSGRKDQNLKQQLQAELQEIDAKIDKKLGENCDQKKAAKALENRIKTLKQILGVENRLQRQTRDSKEQPLSIVEIDQRSLNNNSYTILNQLLKTAGFKASQARQSTDLDQIFGRYRKLPGKSTLIQGFPKESPIEGKIFPSQSTPEVVKVIGLEPEQLFETLTKYRIDVSKMPVFSNTFDSYETFIPGGQATQSAAPVNQAQNLAEKQSYARHDGRSVISLPFNPYHLDNPQKSKLYQAVILDFQDSRNQALKNLTAAQREKQEAAAIKRTWTQIAKRDIPKAFRALQKFQQDTKNQTSKLVIACQKETRKKALKSQRLAKESTQRCKKLTKEVLIFWRKRDRELAELKRKKEKFDKEMRKRQQEEEEQLLQKKRLEYLMKQSEIYAHFMANKMGMTAETKKDEQEQIAAESGIGVKRVGVDEASARKKMAKMINEDRSRLRDFDGSEASVVDEEDLDVNKFDTDNQQQKPIETPTILKATLKEYQLRGLRWLDNLYEQGINGILADEMGLGKTIQAISLLAHIAESKGVWGPFLVVVPVTTLHNWQNELARFCPSLKVMPYFGNQEERKKLSKFLDPKNMNNPALQIHVLITSYNLITNNLKDQAKLLKIKWNYMILDEAQAIKNNASRRWKVLLQFQARNRLLLTGTPIQNSMAELWALLHFIMPKLFDNPEQFHEWFSKDIEASSLNQGELNKIQLKRLHAVLKPFMLRRLKKDVEQEIAPKTVVVLSCEMTYRQRVLYQRIRSKISYKDLHSLTENKSKMENLMNLVMHMRKVCNHPDLFEGRDAKIPVAFRDLQIGVQPATIFSASPEVRHSMTNPIVFTLPKLVFDELLLISDNQNATYRKLVKYEDISLCNFSTELHYGFFNIFNASNLHEGMWRGGAFATFSILRILCASNGWGASDLAFMFTADRLTSLLALIHYYTRKHTLRMSKLNDVGCVNYHTNMTGQFDLQIMDFANQDVQASVLYRQIKITSQVDNSLDVVPPMIRVNELDRQFYVHQMTSLYLKHECEVIYVPKCIADTIQFQCPNSGPFTRFANSIKHNPNAKKVMLGPQIKLKLHLNLQKCSSNAPTQLQIVPNFKLLSPLSSIRLPSHKSLVQDCGKMQAFAKLIPQLVAGGHRCLIFCQMTRMLDLLEDYLLTQHLSYFRLDGSTALQDRRFMVDEYQKNPNIFAFLLSTRAGGLGINLIAADTVIFYDNDWNPTMDEQATDRAHRIGQTKKVTVYRLVTKGTVEERIVRRAQQKQNVQSTVYGDSFKVRDVQMMLAEDDDEQEPEHQQGFIKQRKQRGGKKKQVKSLQAKQADEDMPSDSSDEGGMVLDLDGAEKNQEMAQEDDDAEMQEDY